MKPTICLLCCFFSALTIAQSTLSAGDVIVTSIITDNNDAFQFIPLVDLAENTQIIFTDNGWTGTQLRSGESKATLTVPVGGIAAGTVITLEAGLYPTYVSGSLSALSASGDQIIIYQGTASNPTFIYAITTHSSAWGNGSDSSTETDLPKGLTNGLTAIAVGKSATQTAEWDNAYFDHQNHSLSGTKNQILNLVSDPSNWIQTDTRPTSATWEISSNITLSKQNETQQDVSVFPNPAHGNLLYFKGLHQKSRIEIFNMQGKLVKSEKTTRWLEIGDLDQGLYLIQIITPQKTHRMKWVRQ